MIAIEYDGKTYTDNDILSGECYIARSLLSSTLEVETMEFKLYSENTNLVNFTPDSVVVFRNNGRRIKTFYLQEVKRTGKYVYEFYAVSIAGILDKRNFYGGIYTGQTVGSVVRDIFGSLSISIASNVTNIKLYGWLPVSTRREALAQVLFATSAALTEDSNGRYSIAGLSPEQKRVVSENETSYDASIEYTTSAIDVVVLEHQYTESTEEVTLFEGTANSGDVITFSEPHHSLVASGFSITEHGANYAVVTSGAGKLTGRKYIHSTREVKGKAATRTLSDDAHRVRVENATLVSLVNSRAVADRLADYYTKAERIVSDITYEDDNAGDVLSQYHPYNDKMVQTCVESLDITLSGQLLAKTSSLVGYIPPDISQIEYYDTFEILTGSGNWPVPKGCKNLRAVLIGGGYTGSAGEDGNPGKGVTGGDGGAGGEGGSGGKVYQIDLQNIDGEVYSYAAGSAGSATTFYTSTSDSGSSSDGGYTNILDGKVYAKKGSTGLAGGKGGDGGQGDYNSDWTGDQVQAKPGQDIGGNIGGKNTDSIRNSYAESFAGGGGGGGAAYGQNGGDSPRAPIIDRGGTRGGYGGKGADAISTPTSGLLYGTGGTGGHGGGGGGGGGAASDLDSSVRPDYPPEAGVPGEGGKGSAGSEGAVGCIILFYSIPRKVESYELHNTV